MEGYEKEKKIRDYEKERENEVDDCVSKTKKLVLETGWVWVILALLFHAYCIMDLDTRVGQLEEVTSLANEISSKHTQLLTHHEDKIATGGNPTGE